MDGLDTKICKACKDRKPLSDFYAHPGTKDGRFGMCILCFRAYRKTLYQTVSLGPAVMKVPVVGRWSAVR